MDLVVTLGLVHRGKGEPVTFELEDESAGTQTWFGLIGPAFTALRFGWVLLLDEIDASLHPRLSARLIEIFQDPRDQYPWGPTRLHFSRYVPVEQLEPRRGLAHREGA